MSDEPQTDETPQDDEQAAPADAAEAKAPARKPRRRRASKAAGPQANADDESTPGAAGKPRAAEKKRAAKKATREKAAAPGGTAEAQEAAEAREAAKPAKKAARRVAAGGKAAAKARRRTVRARARYVRTSARKARMVCGHLRGKSVQEARAILAFTPREVARDWSKLLESAVANAESNHELLEEDLIVREAYADEGPTIKRFRPRAMGRATPIRKRTSHLTITLAARAEQGSKARKS